MARHARQPPGNDGGGCTERAAKNRRLALAKDAASSGFCGRHCVFCINGDSGRCRWVDLGRMAEMSTI